MKKTSGDSRWRWWVLPLVPAVLLCGAGLVANAVWGEKLAQALSAVVKLGVIP